MLAAVPVSKQNTRFSPTVVPKDGSNVGARVRAIGTSAPSLRCILRCILSLQQGPKVWLRNLKRALLTFNQRPFLLKQNYCFESGWHIRMSVHACFLQYGMSLNLSNRFTMSIYGSLIYKTDSQPGRQTDR